MMVTVSRYQKLATVPGKIIGKSPSRGLIFFNFNTITPCTPVPDVYKRQTIRKEGLRKVLDDKKCWGQRSRPALFFSGQRAKTGTLS